MNLIELPFSNTTPSTNAKPSQPFEMVALLFLFVRLIPYLKMDKILLFVYWREVILGILSFYLLDQLLWIYFILFDFLLYDLLCFFHLFALYSFWLLLLKFMTLLLQHFL